MAGEAGDRIRAARQRISDLQGELEALGPAPGDAPQMLDSANLRRQADHVAKSDRIRSDMVGAYREYCGALEDALRELVAAQRDLASAARAGLAAGGSGARKLPGKAAAKPAAKRAGKARRAAAGKKPAPRRGRKAGSPKTRIKTGAKPAPRRGRKAGSSKARTKAAAKKPRAKAPGSVKRAARRRRR